MIGTSIFITHILLWWYEAGNFIMSYFDDTTIQLKSYLKCTDRGGTDRLTNLLVNCIFLFHLKGTPLLYYKVRLLESSW